MTTTANTIYYCLTISKLLFAMIHWLRIGDSPVSIDSEQWMTGDFTHTQESLDDHHADKKNTPTWTSGGLTNYQPWNMYQFEVCRGAFAEGLHKYELP